MSKIAEQLTFLAIKSAQRPDRIQGRWEKKYWKIVYDVLGSVGDGPQLGPAESITVWCRKPEYHGFLLLERLGRIRKLMNDQKPLPEDDTAYKPLAEAWRRLSKTLTNVETMLILMEKSFEAPPAPEDQAELERCIAMVLGMSKYRAVCGNDPIDVSKCEMFRHLNQANKWHLPPLDLERIKHFNEQLRKVT